LARDAGPPPLRLFAEGGATALQEALASGRPVEWVATAAEADLVVVPGSRASPASDLTDRESEVLSYLADGWSNEEIGDRLGIGVRTVRFHLDRIYRKLGVGRRTEAVREAVSRGYLRL
jgi:DNA-binding NarL/FixJ family response regulator